jgi:hypothetical protein
VRGHQIQQAQFLDYWSLDISLSLKIAKLAGELLCTENR